MNEPVAPLRPKAAPAAQSAPTQAAAGADVAQVEADQVEAAQVEAAMKTYVGFFAGYFEIGRLAAGRRLKRAGVREPLLHA